MDVKAETGRRVRKLRTQRRMKREDLEETTGIGTGELSKLERGLHAPKLHTLRVVSKGLLAHLSDLTHGLLRTPQSWKAEQVPLRTADELDAAEKALAEYVASQVKAARRSAAHSQQRLAEISGVSLSTLQRIERGMVHVQLQVLVQIAIALGTDLHHLLPPPQQVKQEKRA